MCAWWRHLVSAYEVQAGPDWTVSNTWRRLFLAAYLPVPNLVVAAVLCGTVWAASLLSCVTCCSLYTIVYVCMYYMLVRLSGCLNHIKGTIIIIIVN